jgi:NAD(P)-dependent dehydrogenase (short-subunit alcohol dehydrogenase family)
LTGSAIDSLQGKRAVVTGTSSGIGRAVAEQLIAAGSIVYGADIDEDVGQAMAGQDRGPGNGAFRFTKVDFTVPDQLDEWLTGVYADAGHIDVLCNVVGISDVLPIEQTDDAILERTMAINFYTPFRICRWVAPSMKRDGGVILNVASELAFVAQPGFSAYCASKGALVSFTRALALEMSPYNVRVNVLCPGPTETPMLNAEFETFGDKKSERSQALGAIPLNRFGDPEEIAKIAMFLVSDHASFMQGAAVMADGGKTLL